MPVHRSRRFKVVVNHEEQLRVLRDDDATPEGWQDLGARESKEDLLSWLRELWRARGRSNESLDERLHEILGEEHTDRDVDEHVPRR